MTIRRFLAECAQAVCRPVLYFWNTAAIVQWQNAALWQRMSWVRNPLAAPISPSAKSPFWLTVPVPRIRKVSPARSTVVAPKATPHLFAGTSGWAYPTWKPGFYPATVPAKKFLEFYASKLSAVEVNYTFSKLPTAKMVESWLAATSADFRFSFKAPQRITHFKRLLECGGHVAQFVESLEAVREAGRMGVLLFQLPPNFKANHDRLADFLTELAPIRPMRVAFEFRHESWFTDATYDILRMHDAALCIAESDELATPEVHTAAAFTYFRLRRNGGYSAAKLKGFAERFAALAVSRDVYVHFKHEDEPTGALNAVAFLKRVAGVKSR